MKHLLTVCVLLLMLCTPCLAQNIGPASPALNFPENISTPNFGAGLSYNQAEWEGYDVESQRAYAHFGAVFGDIYTPYYELYGRIGVANLEFNDFDGGTEPMYAAGMRVQFKQARIFGWGGVFQALYMNSFEDNLAIDGEIYHVSLEDNWEVDAAFPIHARIANGLVYFGPVYYHATSNMMMYGPEGFRDEETVDEKNNVGAFGGLALRLGNLSLEFEVRYKSDLSAGALATMTF